MRDLICDVIGYYARSCGMGKAGANDNILIVNLIKEKM